MPATVTKKRPSGATKPKTKGVPSKAKRKPSQKAATQVKAASKVNGKAANSTPPRDAFTEVQEGLRNSVGNKKDFSILERKHVIAIRHTNIRGNVAGVAVGSNVAKFASKYLSPKKDKNCVITKKGYPTIALENPTSDDIMALMDRVVKRAKL